MQRRSLVSPTRLSWCVCSASAWRSPNLRISADAASAEADAADPVRGSSCCPQFDKDGKGYLSAAERKAAREYLATQPRRGRGRVRRRPRFRRRRNRLPYRAPASSLPAVKSYTNEPLYDLQTLRTLFLEFEDDGWEKELADFYHTDVDVPARLTVDGKVYPDAGVALPRAVVVLNSIGGAQTLARHLSTHGPRGSAPGRIPFAQPAQLQRRPDVPAYRAVSICGAPVHAGAEGELGPRGDQRRKLGHLRQYTADQFRLHPGVVSTPRRARAGRYRGAPARAADSPGSATTRRLTKASTKSNPRTTRNRGRR